jgi:hypothetical protein
LDVVKQLPLPEVLGPPLLELLHAAVTNKTAIPSIVRA